MIRVVAAAVALLALVGCTAPEAVPQPRETTAIPTPTPTPTPVPVTFTLSCTYEDPTLYNPSDVNSSPLDANVRQTFYSYEAAWRSGKPWEYCDTQQTGGRDYSDLQIAATEVAGYDSVESVDTLIGLCAAVNGSYVRNGIVSEAQGQEVAGMLTLCPDFPAAAQLQAASALAQQLAAERAAGTRFAGGVFEVGTQVQPGRYQSNGDIRNCYWERLDAAGEIIDNNFVSATTQVQITVAATDFAIHVDGCGEFAKIG